MIPRANITAWRTVAPWPDDAQVEQDLALSRAIVELYSNPFVAERLAFRGATALYKLCFPVAYRYSEDLDFVQRRRERIGPTLDEVRSTLDPWLGDAEWDQTERGTTLVYRFESEIEPVVPLRVKIEVNTREHATCFGFVERPLVVDNPWFRGEAAVGTYEVDELLGTKLRALYQRKQGRDLFDLGAMLRRRELAPQRIVEAFQFYLGLEGVSVSRAEFEENLRRKMADPEFLEDIRPLLAEGVDYDPHEAFDLVMSELLAHLPGDPWKGALD